MKRRRFFTVTMGALVFGGLLAAVRGSADSPAGAQGVLTDLPGVTLHVDEARSWFGRTRQNFDLIQMSLVDTWAATGAGAFSLSENGLYTREGWRIVLDWAQPTTP